MSFSEAEQKNVNVNATANRKAPFNPQAAAAEVPVQEFTGDAFYENIFDAAVTTATGTVKHETVNAAVERMTVIAELPEHRGLGLKFLLINNANAAALPFVLAYNTVGKGKGFFTFLMEELLYSPLEVRTANIQGNQVTIDTDTASVFDEDLIELALATLKDTTGADYAPAGFMVVKRQRDLGQEGYVNLLFDTAKTALVHYNGRPSMQASMLTSRGLRVNVMNEVHPGANTLDLEGNPVTSDFTVSMSAAPAQERRQNKVYGEQHHNRRSQSLRLAKVSGYVDMFRFNDPVNQPTVIGNTFTVPAYHPYLVLTDISGFNEQTGQSIENPITNILGLLAIAQMATGNNFASVYRKSGSKTSLGVLGYDHEPDINKPFVPRELVIQNSLMGQQSPDVATVDSIINTFFYPKSLSVAIDIRKGGRSSWNMEMFRMAALGVPEANEAIIDIVDEFTMGNFRNIYGSQPVFQQDLVTIHSGTYQDENGQTRDVRDFDYLKMASMYKTDTQAQMPDFSQSFVPGTSCGDFGAMALDYRRKVLQQVAGAEIDGLHDRAFLAPAFLDAFVEAVAATGLSVEGEGLYDPTVAQSNIGSFRAGSAIGSNQVFSNGNAAAGMGGHYLHRGYQR